MLGINPSNRLAVDGDVIEEENIGSDLWSTVVNRLLLDQFGLSSQSDTLFFKPIR